jgi:hypothetical protein
MNKKLPRICPACASPLMVQCLHCSQCDTQVSGSFALPPLLLLNEEDHDFILEFVKCSGSLKIMAERLDLSYPSVRNRLDDLIEHLNQLQQQQKQKQ